MEEENKYVYQEDVQKVIDKIFQKIEKIIQSAPTFYLEIDKAPYILSQLFNTDGTPNGNFNVPESYQKKARVSLQHRYNGSNGYWYGQSINDKYLIKVTPDFLTEEELDELQSRHFIVKKLGNTEVKLKQIKLGMGSRYYGKYEMSYAGGLSDLDRKKIKKARELLNEWTLIIEQLRVVQSKLSHLSREVIDESSRSGNHK